MTRDRAAVKKIVHRAIKNNPQVIVALILALGELVRGPGAPALTSAEAEDAIDEVKPGNARTLPEGSRLGVFEPASDSVHAAGKVLFAQDAAAEQRIGQRQKLSFRIRRAAVYGFAEPVLDMAPFERGQGAAGRQALEDRVEADLPGRIGVGDAVTRRQLLPGPALVLYRVQQRDRRDLRPGRVRSGGAEDGFTAHGLPPGSWCSPPTGRLALWTGRTSSALRSGRGNATPIMQSRVTISASCSSLQLSVPAGRIGRTIKRHF